jgi:hypothetical protein
MLGDLAHVDTLSACSISFQANCRVANAKEEADPAVAPVLYQDRGKLCLTVAVCASYSPDRCFFAPIARYHRAVATATP